MYVLNSLKPNITNLSLNPGGSCYLPPKNTPLNVSVIPQNLVLQTNVANTELNALVYFNINDSSANETQNGRVTKFLENLKTNPVKTKSGRNSCST